MIFIADGQKHFSGTNMIFFKFSRVNIPHLLSETGMYIMIVKNEIVWLIETNEII